MSLESPEADKVLNAGTAAPNCQPKKTVKEQREDQEDPEGDKRLSEKHRRNSSVSEHNGEAERRKRQHTEQQQAMTAQQQKKLSYIQMAKLGYQELVNAIIRPPRADYKVCTHIREGVPGLVMITRDWKVPRRILTLSFVVMSRFLVHVDGGIGASCLYVLWKTIYPDGLYSAHKTWIQLGMFALGARRKSRGSYSCCHLHARKLERPS